VKLLLAGGLPQVIISVTV